MPQWHAALLPGLCLACATWHANGEKAKHSEQELRGSIGAYWQWILPAAVLRAERGPPPAS